MRYVVSRLSALLAIALVSGACAPSWILRKADSAPGRRTIEGRVTLAPTGAPFQDAWVSTLSGSDSVRTDARGRFVLTAPLAEHAVRIEQPRYGTLIISNLNADGARTFIDARLSVPVPNVPDVPVEIDPALTTAGKVASLRDTGRFNGVGGFASGKAGAGLGA
jgi:hypothetical protein